MFLRENCDTQGEADYGILYGKFSCRTLLINENSVSVPFYMTDCFGFCCLCLASFSGDVLTGTKSGDRIHTGLLQEWFGFHWWTSRAFALLIVVLLVILPLVLFRRIGN